MSVMRKNSVVPRFRPLSDQPGRHGQRGGSEKIEQVAAHVDMFVGSMLGLLRGLLGLLLVCRLSAISAHEPGRGQTLQPQGMPIGPQRHERDRIE